MSRAGDAPMRLSWRFQSHHPAFACREECGCRGGAKSEKKKKKKRKKDELDLPQQPCEPTASRQDATRTFFEGALDHSSGAGYLGG